MRQAAKRMEFEKAALMRDEIVELRSIMIVAGKKFVFE
jgi:excinuclease UvrABC helicase subunit UvrB